MIIIECVHHCIPEAFYAIYFEKQDKKDRTETDIRGLKPELSKTRYLCRYMHGTSSVFVGLSWNKD
jgi:hypothetical protein